MARLKTRAPSVDDQAKTFDEHKNPRQCQTQQSVPSGVVGILKELKKIKFI